MVDDFSNPHLCLSMMVRYFFAPQIMERLEFFYAYQLIGIRISLDNPIPESKGNFILSDRTVIVSIDSFKYSVHQTIFIRLNLGQSHGCITIGVDPLQLIPNELGYFVCRDGTIVIPIGAFEQMIDMVVQEPAKP
jgi:hypothetical protein